MASTLEHLIMIFNIVTQAYYGFCQYLYSSIQLLLLPIQHHIPLMFLSFSLLQRYLSLNQSDKHQLTNNTIMLLKTTKWNKTV